MTFYAIAKPIPGLKSVVGFGISPTGEFLIEEQKEVEIRIAGSIDKEKTIEFSTRKAEDNEIARIKAMLEKDYNVSLSEKSVSSQEESSSNGMTDKEYQQWLKDNGLTS